MKIFKNWSAEQKAIFIIILIIAFFIGTFWQDITEAAYDFMNKPRPYETQSN